MYVFRVYFFLLPDHAVRQRMQIRFCVKQQVKASQPTPFLGQQIEVLRLLEFVVTQPTASPALMRTRHFSGERFRTARVDHLSLNQLFQYSLPI